MYNMGREVSGEVDFALQRFEAKGNNGNMRAMYAAGEIYLAKNKAYDAFEWFEKAARAGYINAMTMVSAMYETGTGVTKDNLKAEEWSAKAKAAMAAAE